MDATQFSVILADLIGRIPGAYAAALVDVYGETVDYAGTIEPFDVKIAAAHMRIVLSQVDSFGKLGEVRSLVIRAATTSFVVRKLPIGYAVALLLRKRAGFTASERAFAVCERLLAVEAGWPCFGSKPRWYPVDVAVDRRDRPTNIGPTGIRRLGQRMQRVEVIGSVVGLRPHEKGFRVRTEVGEELTLVREARRCWYADEVVSFELGEKQKRS
jgi:hypothetical protein